MRLDEVQERLGELSGADVVTLWRTAWDEDVAAVVTAARSAGVRLVFDVDDLMVDPNLAQNSVIDGIRSQGLTEAQVRDHYAQIQQAMMAADLCTTTTQELAGHMRALHKPTFVLPNGFDAQSCKPPASQSGDVGRHRMMDLSALATRPARARISATSDWLPALWPGCWPSGRLAGSCCSASQSLGLPVWTWTNFLSLPISSSRWNGAIWYPLRNCLTRWRGST